MKALPDVHYVRGSELVLPATRKSVHRCDPSTELVKSRIMPQDVVPSRSRLLASEQRKYVPVLPPAAALTVFSLIDHFGNAYNFPFASVLPPSLVSLELLLCVTCISWNMEWEQPGRDHARSGPRTPAVSLRENYTVSLGHRMLWLRSTERGKLCACLS